MHFSHSPTTAGEKASMHAGVIWRRWVHSFFSSSRPLAFGWKATPQEFTQTAVWQRNQSAQWWTHQLWHLSHVFLNIFTPDSRKARSLSPQQCMYLGSWTSSWTNHPVMFSNQNSFWRGLSRVNSVLHYSKGLGLLLRQHANIGVCIIFVTPPHCWLPLNLVDSLPACHL